VCGRTACTIRCGGGWKRSRPDQGHWGGATVRETGGHEGPRPYRQRATAPAPDPTRLRPSQRGGRPTRCGARRRGAGRGMRGVAEDQPGRAGVVAVPGQRVHKYVGPVDLARQVRVVGQAGQAGERDQQVQPRSDALDAGLGQVLVQRREQRVAPVALVAADQADVPLKLAVRDHLGEHHLRQRRAAEVAGVLGRDQVQAQLARRDQPAQADAGCQRELALGGWASTPGGRAGNTCRCSSPATPSTRPCRWRCSPPGSRSDHVPTPASPGGDVQRVHRKSLSAAAWSNGRLGS
jgi:hypothetical protein